MAANGLVIVNSVFECETHVGMRGNEIVHCE